jgi:hypothetical protein
MIKAEGKKAKSRALAFVKKDKGKRTRDKVGTVVRDPLRPVSGNCHPFLKAKG